MFGFGVRSARCVLGVAAVLCAGGCQDQVNAAEDGWLDRGFEDKGEVGAETRVVGRLVGAPGEDLAGVDVFIVRDGVPVVNTVADARGDFVFESAPAARVEIVANDSGGRAYLADATLFPGGENSLGELELARVGEFPGVLGLRGVGFEERVTAGEDDCLIAGVDVEQEVMWALGCGHGLARVDLKSGEVTGLAVDLAPGGGYYYSVRAHRRGELLHALVGGDLDNSGRTCDASLFYHVERDETVRSFLDCGERITEEWAPSFGSLSVWIGGLLLVVRAEVVRQVPYALGDGTLHDISRIDVGGMDIDTGEVTSFFSYEGERHELPELVFLDEGAVWLGVPEHAPGFSELPDRMAQTRVFMLGSGDDGVDVERSLILPQNHYHSVNGETLWSYSFGDDGIREWSADDARVLSQRSGDYASSGSLSPRLMKFSRGGPEWYRSWDAGILDLDAGEFYEFELSDFLGAERERACVHERFDSNYADVTVYDCPQAIELGASSWGHHWYSSVEQAWMVRSREGTTWRIDTGRPESDHASVGVYGRGSTLTAIAYDPNTNGLQFFQMPASGGDAIQQTFFPSYHSKPYEVGGALYFNMEDPVNKRYQIFRFVPGE